MRHPSLCSETSSPDSIQVGQPITCVTSSSSLRVLNTFQMWLQAIAIILPRVQDQYGVSNNVIGALSSSTFAGMFLGAFVWGTCTHLGICPLPLISPPCPYSTCLLMACFVLICRLGRLREGNGVQPHLNSHNTCWRRSDIYTVLYPVMRCHVFPRDSSWGACSPHPVCILHLLDSLRALAGGNRGACRLTRHWHWRHYHDQTATY